MTKMTFIFFVKHVALLLLLTLGSPLNAQVVVEDAEVKVVFDSINKLEFLGHYDSSKLLLRDSKIEFYIAGKHYNNGSVSLRYVAVHDIAEDEPLLDVNVRDKNSALNSYQFTNSAADYYNEIINKIVKISPDAIYEDVNGRTLMVYHHTKDRAPYNDKELVKYSILIRLDDLRTDHLTTNIFKYDDGVWRLHQHNNFSFSYGEANTVSEAISRRRVLLKKGYNEYRRNHMTPAELAADDKAIADAIKAKKKAQQAKADEIDRKINKKKTEKKGLVYRDLSYWKNYEHKSMANIFNGESELISDLNHFKFVYIKFLYQYFLDCRSFIPPGSPGRDVTKQTIITDGLYTNTIDGKVTKYRAKSKFWEKYKAYEETVTIPGFENMLTGLMNASNPGKLKSAIKNMHNIIKDIQRLFADAQCDSGMMQQFEENLYRISHDKTTLHKDGVIHPYLKRDKN